MNKKQLSQEDQKRIQYISTFLKVLRQNNGYTQEEVANAIGLGRNSLSKIELGRTFRIQHLFLLIDFYQIKLSELFEDVD